MAYSSLQKYKYELEKVKEFTNEGKSCDWIINELKITKYLYNLYVKNIDQNLDLSGVLSSSKEKLVANLKKSLWQEALGYYEYEETKKLMEKIPFVTNKKDKDGNPIIEYKEKQKLEKIKKIARPVPTLLIFALCNLAGDQFKRVDKDVEELLKETMKEAKEANSKIKFKSEILQAAFNEIYNIKKIKENKDGNKKE